MSTNLYPTETSDEFCIGTYRGHAIATFRYRRGWLAILDDQSFPAMAFENSYDAIRWLRLEVDNRQLCRRRRNRTGAAVLQCSAAA